MPTLSPMPPRKKRGKNATPEGKAERIAKLRASAAPNTSTDAGTALANPNRPLTDKMKLFVYHWAAGETILSASYRAGYSDCGAYAYKLAKDPAILRLYNYEKQKYEEAAQMTRKQVMDGLLDGIATAKMLGEPASMISGWREVGKMCGYYEPIKKTIDINIRGTVTMKHLENLSDAELLGMIKGEITDVDFTEIPDGDGSEEDE